MSTRFAELGPKEQRIYRRHIHDHSHFAEFAFDLLTLDEKPVKRVPGGTGTVAITDSDPISRGFSGEIPDPYRLIDVDSDVPGTGSIYPTRMLRITSLIDVPQLGDTITEIPFIGPISKYSRDGSKINVEGQGKEAFWFFGCGPMTIPSGAEVVDAIRRILRHIGETRMQLSETDIPCYVLGDIVVGPDEEIRPGKILKKLASAAGMQLFARNDGVIVLRPPVKRPVTVFEQILSVPKLEFDASELVNDVRVTGKPGVFGSAHLPKEHPFGRDNPQMMRGGQPGWRTRAIRNDQIGSDAQAEKVAKAELLEASRNPETVAVDLPCDYGLNPRDPITINAPAWSKTFPLRTGNLAIGPGVLAFGIDLKTRVRARRRKGA